MKRRRNVESYWTIGPHDPIDLKIAAWPDEVTADLATIFDEPALALLVDARVRPLLERAQTAPRRKKAWQRISDANAEARELAPLPDAGWYRDMRTGENLVYEDLLDPPHWALELPLPQGAFTLGEMTGLLDALRRTGETFVREAQAGRLSRAQREKAARIAEAIENLELRLAVKQLQPSSPEEAEALKRSALGVLAGEGSRKPELKIVDSNPSLKRKLMR